MNLRRQIFLSFLFVSILPLIVFCVYLFQTNLYLAFDLHKQNLYNSTAIQADILEDHINRMIVRINKFATAKPIQRAVKLNSSTIFKDNQITEEITKFTDETLDSISMFVLTDINGDILYTSGSNKDIEDLRIALPYIQIPQKTTVYEISLGKKTDNISIVAPIYHQGTLAGAFVAVYSSEFFLKTISSHRQIESSNAFLFCREHNNLVESKHDITLSPDEFVELTKGSKEGGFIGKIGSVQSVVYFRRISGTSWILANDIPVAQVYSQVSSYGVITLFVFTLILFVIIMLSRMQRMRILQPLNHLLGAVESFFVSGASRFSCDGIDKKTEIGYLAEKFAGMTADITLVQDKLIESNYLYKALLHATYELEISINYRENTASSSSEDIATWFAQDYSASASEKVMQFLELPETDLTDVDKTILNNIVCGNIVSPVETEIYCIMSPSRGKCWYRLIAVPIISADKRIYKTVLHFEDITAKKHEMLLLLQSSQRDPLCGLLNKRAFITLAEQFISVSSGITAFFFIDLDNFKQINDTLGHTVGDEVLIRTAQIVTEQFRSTDLVARYGGDEFVICASGMSKAHAERKANDLLTALSMDYGSAEHTVHITGSIGIFLSYSVYEIATMIKFADDAMYKAKQAGKSCYSIIEGIEQNEAF